MARQKVDVLLVRKDAPVQTMRLGPWLLYFFMLLMILILAALAGGGYLLYQQNLAMGEMVTDNRRLRLAAQNLETIVRDLQDRAFVARMPNEGPPPPPPPPPARAQTPPLRPQAAPVKPAAAEAPAKESDSATTSPSAQALEPWPTSAAWVDVRNIKRKKTGRELLVYFDVTNKKDSKHPAVGYVTVLLRSQRQGSPWVEAWPPARLTPLGRPENPKKGATFSVQRRRNLRARFALVDKDVEAIEFLVYDNQGELALLVREAVGSKKKSDN